jgi:hypothetical protein
MGPTERSQCSLARAVIRARRADLARAWVDGTTRSRVDAWVAEIVNAQKVLRLYRKGET